MKKTVVTLAIAAAALALASCNKIAGTPAVESDTTTIRFSSIIEHPQQQTQTKTTFGAMKEDGTNQIVHWQDTDEIQLYSWTSSATAVNDNGAFTIEDIQDYTGDDGNDVYTQATFVGEVPNANLTDTKGIAIFPYVAGRRVDKGGNPKFYLDLPTEQDGTGAKYVVATAGMKPGAFNDLSVIGAFNIISAMFKINVPQSYLSSKITTVRLDLEANGSKGNLAFLAGRNCTIQNNNLMGGDATSITVKRADGSFVTGDVYFCTRILTNADFYPIDLVLTFISKDGKEAKARTTLNGDVTIRNAKLYDFGTISGLKFKTPDAPEPDPEPAENLVLDLDWATNGNNVLYYLDGVTKTYLPTANTASSKALHFDQDGVTYDFNVNYHLGAGWKYNANESDATNIVRGLFLATGQTNLQLPVISGYRLATIGIAHGQTGTGNKVFCAAQTDFASSIELQSPITVAAPYVKGGTLATITIPDNFDASAPVYIAGRASATSVYSNTVVAAKLVLTYVKL